jgi:hypothetical protein
VAFRMTACLAACVLGVAASAIRAAADDPEGASAALDAHLRHEEVRRGDIAAQIGTQEWLRFRAGLPDRRLYYGGLPGGGSLLRGAQPMWWDFDGVFEPWPVAGGWIFGYRYDNPVEQPAGHYFRLRSDGGYEYGPVYERPLPAIEWPEFAPAASESPRHVPRRPPPPPAPGNVDNGPREF